MPTFQEIIESHKVNEFIAQIPFDADYASLNKLKFLFQKLKVLPGRYFDSDNPTLSEKIHDDIEQTLESIREIKKFFYDMFKDEKVRSLWQEYIVQKLGGKVTHLTIEKLLEETESYLPSIYAEGTDNLSAAEIRFPSGIKDRNTGLDFAHYDKSKIKPNSNSCLIASHAPRIMAAYPEINSQNMQSFLGMLQSRNVKYILALGGNTERLNYRHSSGGVLQTTSCASAQDTLQENQHKSEEIIQLKDTSTGEVKTIYYAGLSVSDNEPLNLTDRDLSVLSAIYDIYQNDTILVHCDSGVGRTGQVRLLFSLLDQYHHPDNDSFKIKCDNLLTKLINKEQLAEHDVVDMIIIMKDRLADLRKSRYCIQVLEQFVSSLAQLFLFIAYRNNYDKELIGILRGQMNIAQSRIGVYNFGFADNIEVQSGTDSETPSSHPPSRMGANNRFFSALSSASAEVLTPSKTLFDNETPRNNSTLSLPLADTLPGRAVFSRERLPSEERLRRLAPENQQGVDSLNGSPANPTY